MPWAQLHETDEFVSTGVFPCQALQRNQPGWHCPQGRARGSANSSAVPPVHPSASLTPCWAMGTHAAQEMLFPSLSVLGKKKGWTEASACWLINAISVSKASPGNQYSVFKKHLLLITGFSMSRDTGRNQWSMCVPTLQARELLYPTMAPSLPGTVAGV